MLYLGDIRVLVHVATLAGTSVEQRQWQYMAKKYDCLTVGDTRYDMQHRFARADTLVRKKGMLLSARSGASCTEVRSQLLQAWPACERDNARLYISRCGEFVLSCVHRRSYKKTSLLTPKTCTSAIPSSWNMAKLDRHCFAQCRFCTA